MKKKSLLIIFGLFIIIFLMGCAFPFQVGSEAQISDISNELTFQKISRNAFMGGSILYNPDNPASGQLSKGVTVAIRLGYVNKEVNSNDECIYTDMEDSARYGYITISQIDKTEVSFTYTYYDQNGNYALQSDFTIKTGEKVDINSDGNVDLLYDYPVQKREGFKNALWLTFLSNQDNCNTSMFAVLPSQYSRGIYPSGIMGINPYGKFVVNKYEVNSINRAAVQGVKNGDYVLDTLLGEYQRITSTFSFKHARSIDESELESMSEITQTSFYFCPEEFDKCITADALLGELPDVLIQSQDNTGLSCIDVLNKILDYKYLVIEIANSKGLDTNIPEVSEVIENLKTTTQDKIVEFNRYLLEAFYPELCPALSYTDNCITTIFPLLSVLITNPDSENKIECFDNQRSASTIGTTNSYRDYLTQKSEIDKIFSDYYPIENFSYAFPLWENLFKEKNIDGSSAGKKIGGSDLRGNIGDLEDIVSVLKKPIETNKPTKINNAANLTVGVIGHFKISFSNIEGGIYAGLYISADTSLDISKSFAEYPVSDIPKLGWTAKETLLNINLELFDAPPVTIGVVSLRFSMCGGIEVPASVNLTGTVTTNMYAGFTGFYAAGFDAGANYGITTKTVKLWRLTIKIPSGFYFDPYARGKVINETASFVGPVSEITTIPGVKLQSGKLEFRLSPSVYIEPGIIVANCLYGGIKIAPYIDLGMGLQLNIDDTQQFPKGLELYGIFGGGINLKGTYGIKMTLPFFNKKIDTTGTVPFKNIKFIDNDKQVLSKIIF